MNAEERKNRIIWGILLLIGALGSASLRNNPALGITPFAVGVIDALIFVCILCAVKFSDWKMAVIIAAATPIYLWMQRFLDGYMILVKIAANLTLVGSMCFTMTNKTKSSAFVWKCAVITLLTCAVAFLGGAVALWIVKHESFIRSFIVSWNTELFSCLSILGAVIVSLLLTGDKARV